MGVIYPNRRAGKDTRPTIDIGACVILSGVLFTPLLFMFMMPIGALIGQYRSFKWNTVSYCVMSMWVIGQQGAYWVAKDWIRQLTYNRTLAVDIEDLSLQKHQVVTHDREFINRCCEYVIELDGGKVTNRYAMTAQSDLTLT